MKDNSANPYEHDELASYYASLGYEGTYLLCVRDTPAIIAAHDVSGTCLDFACGAGRSSRFLKSLGFDVTGVDISQPMLEKAAAADPEGTYLLIEDGDLAVLEGRTYDLVFAAFPFESMSSLAWVTHNLAELSRHMKDGALFIVVGATKELYRNEWVSFTTVGFDNNRSAESADPVTIAFRERPDMPVVDYFWTDESYREAFRSASLSVLETHWPTASPDDGRGWMSELIVAPFVIYVLRREA